MTAAPVGFQCPECVREGAKTVREARTTFGGKLTEGALVTKILIGINLVAFVFELVIGTSKVVERFAVLGFAQSNTDGSLIGISTGEYYRLITGTFLHGSILHIAFNMLALYALGPTLEHVLGRARFVAMYLICAFTGSAVSYAFSANNVPAVGASGAIFGLMGAILILGRKLNFDLRQLGVLIAINFAIGFVVPNIDWRAHLGGFLAGMAIGAGFAYGPKRKPGEGWQRETAFQVLVMAGVFAVALGLVLWRTSQLHQQFPIS